MNKSIKYITNRFKISILFMSLVMGLSAMLGSNVSGATVDTPTFNYESGKYYSPISVTIHCASPNVNIYYTTDGTIPDENSKLYRGYPILVSHHASGDSVTFTADNDPDPSDDNVPLSHRSMIIKAVAINESLEKSEIATATYVIDLVEGTFNIAYDVPPAGGGSKHMLDVYQPIGKKNNPVLIFIHGGAWKKGDKNIYMELGNTFAGYYGITTVIANYRLSTDPWYAKHPDHIEDVAKAFKWVYDHIEEYGGDRENIYLFGQSAGGHLVSLLGTDSNYLSAHGLSLDDIKGVISMSGAYDLYDLVEWPNNPLGLNAAEVLEYKALCQNTFGGWDKGLLDNASPAKFIKPTQPPFLIIALNETDTFHDMPGFGQEALNFYSAILGLNGPAVDLKLLNESDIPPAILELDFSEEYNGHYHEIYAINTIYWDCLSVQMVADYVQDIPDTPIMESPSQGMTNVSLTPDLTWRRCSTALYYYVQVATQTTFDSETLIFDSPVADTSWSLTNLSPETIYYWRVKAINALGESEWSSPHEFQTTGSTSVDFQNTSVPQQFTMSLYPNPFNGVVKINIELSGFEKKNSSRIEIYDVLGRNVYAKKIDLASGQNVFSWHPLNMPSGIYMIHVAYGDKRLMSKVMYLK